MFLPAFAESKTASTTTLDLDFPTVWDRTPHRFWVIMIFILLCIFLSGVSVSHVAHPKSCVSSEGVLKYLGLDCCLGLCRAFCLFLYVVDFALLSPARAVHAIASISLEMMHRWMEYAKCHAVRLCRASGIW